MGPPPSSPRRVRHEYCGHINPRCIVCGKTPMQAQLAPYEPWQRLMAKAGETNDSKGARVG